MLAQKVYNPFEAMKSEGMCHPMRTLGAASYLQIVLSSYENLVSNV